MLNLFHLKYFCDAAAQQSLSEASRRNRVSRPAVSQAIRALEKALGTELLVHRKNAFVLTEAGERLVASAPALFAQVHWVQEQVSEGDAAVAGRLRIGASHSLAASVLPAALSRYDRDFPRVQISLKTGNALRIASLLTDGEVDLGIAMHESALEGWPREPLRRGKFVLVSRPISAAPGSASDPAKARYLVGDRGVEVDRLRREFASRYDRPLPVRMEIQSWEVIAALAGHGLGWGLVPDFVAGSRAHRSLQVMDGGLGSQSYEICAYFGREQALRRSAQELLKVLKTLI